VILSHIVEVMSWELLLLTIQSHFIPERFMCCKDLCFLSRCIDEVTSFNFLQTLAFVTAD